MSELNCKEFRLICTGSADAITNMAIDEALLEGFEKDANPILRVYSWSDSFTLGISQKIKDYQELYQPNTSFAKRITGGGVLFHGHDVSYSVILPSDTFGTLDVKQSYEKLCSFLIAFYEDLGLNPVFAKDEEATTTTNSPYCQIGFEPYDILIEGKKIGGNAQRRMRDKIFQHGSIPFKKNNTYTKWQGYNLGDFGVELGEDEVSEKLFLAFHKTFAMPLDYSCFSEKEEQLITALIKEKYANSTQEEA